MVQKACAQGLAANTGEYWCFPFKRLRFAAFWVLADTLDVGGAVRWCHSLCLQAHRSTVVVPPSPLLKKARCICKSEPRRGTCARGDNGIRPSFPKKSC